MLVVANEKDRELVGAGASTAARSENWLLG